MTLNKEKINMYAAVNTIINNYMYKTRLPGLRLFKTNKIQHLKQFTNNQRLSRACIVHLVIKKTNWSYVKTMSCVILELRST